MDIERIAEECNIFPSVNTDITLDELALFAQKIREARDAEWMAEPIVDCNVAFHVWKSIPEEGVMLYAKPKEVK